EFIDIPGVPGLLGGGGGGGRGGVLSIRAGGDFPDRWSRRISARGGRGGSGGVTVVDARSGNWRTDYVFDGGSNGPSGSSVRIGPLFDPSSLDTSVTTRTLVDARDFSTGP